LELTLNSLLTENRILDMEANKAKEDLTDLQEKGNETIK